ncbi:hypothetical protein [Reichenbachiella versicolor]|uniref:hypothetical protein n=1 Tax=Reichenbachiella versicolor TaxID=1821036 RepID=UPI000D6E6867|nr:hypothetical protein [Reichenbachiella versicolor]
MTISYAKRLIFTIVLFAILVLIGLSQKAAAQYRDTYKLPSTQIGDLGKIKYFIGTQLWMRYTDMNPGTTIGEESVNQSFDISMRRFRVNASSQMGDIYWKVQFGINNMNQTYNRHELWLLDAYAKWTAKKYFQVGLGKSMYYGLSRYSALSTSTMIALEVPLTALATINKTDDIIRRNSLFVEGQVGKFDYCMVFAKPYMSPVSAPSPEPKFENPDYYRHDGFQPSGYFVYRFKDSEAMGSAAPGSYLGKKTLINLGAGFLFEDEAMWSASQEGDVYDTLTNDIKHWAVDFLIDMPLDADNNTSFTFYAMYLNTDYGKGYVRNSGTNNFATGSNGSAFNNKGNLYPTMGTGDVVYAQAAYRWKAKSIEKMDSFMPFATINYGNFDALSDPSILYEYGINFLLRGHSSKLSLGVQHRPIFEANESGDLKQTDYKMLAVLQYSIVLKS